MFSHAETCELRVRGLSLPHHTSPLCPQTCVMFVCLDPCVRGTAVIPLHAGHFKEVRRGGVVVCVCEDGAGGGGS